MALTRSRMALVRLLLSFQFSSETILAMQASKGPASPRSPISPIVDAIKSLGNKAMARIAPRGVPRRRLPPTDGSAPMQPLPRRRLPGTPAVSPFRQQQPNQKRGRSAVYQPEEDTGAGVRMDDAKVEGSTAGDDDLGVSQITTKDDSRRSSRVQWDPEDDRAKQFDKLHRKIAAGMNRRSQALASSNVTLNFRRPETENGTENVLREDAVDLNRVEDAAIWNHGACDRAQDLQRKHLYEAETRRLADRCAAAAFSSELAAAVAAAAVDGTNPMMEDSIFNRDCTQMPRLLLPNERPMDPRLRAMQEACLGSASWMADHPGRDPGVDSRAIWIEKIKRGSGRTMPLPNHPPPGLMEGSPKNEPLTQTPTFTSPRKKSPETVDSDEGGLALCLYQCIIEPCCVISSPVSSAKVAGRAAVQPSRPSVPLLPNASLLRRGSGGAEEALIPVVPKENAPRDELPGNVKRGSLSRPAGLMSPGVQNHLSRGGSHTMTVAKTTTMYTKKTWSVKPEEFDEGKLPQFGRD